MESVAAREKLKEQPPPPHNPPNPKEKTKD